MKYWDFYKKCRADGDTIILDNGAYEGQLVDKHQYCEMIKDLKPTAYVVPDVIGNFQASIDLAHDFIVGLIPGERIEVFQGQNENQLSYFMHDFAERGGSWVALPKAAGEKRVEFARYIRRYFPDFKIHALGFIDKDPLAELPVLAELGVGSIDSSHPVAYGLPGKGSSKFKDAVHNNFQPNHQCDKNLAEVFTLCGAKESTMTVTLNKPQRKYYPGKVLNEEELKELGVEATIAQRDPLYGGFPNVSRVAQALKSVMHASRNWEHLTEDKQEALEMIVHKIARILNGDPNYRDSWHDIEGYAKLVSNTLNKGEK